MLHKMDFRQLRIISHALTLLNYKDAVVDGVRITEQEFNRLMDLIAEHVGAEVQRIQKETLMTAVTPEQERRIRNGNGQSRPPYIGPERRGMREAAADLHLTGIHRVDEYWYAEDEYHEQWGWIDGAWKKLFR